MVEGSGAADVWCSIAHVQPLLLDIALAAAPASSSIAPVLPFFLIIALAAALAA